MVADVRGVGVKNGRINADVVYGRPLSHIMVETKPLLHQLILRPNNISGTETSGD